MKVFDGTLSVYADLSDIAAGDLNDLVVDDVGRAYVGNFGYDLFGGAPIEVTDMHLVEPNGTVRVAASGLEFPNGAVIVDCGRTLIVAETWCGKLTAYDRAANGDLSNRRIFADLGGRQPDGICADRHGAIWAGCYNTGEFVRVLEGGEITDRIEFDGNAVSCTLGGKNAEQMSSCERESGAAPSTRQSWPYSFQARRDLVEIFAQEHLSHRCDPQPGIAKLVHMHLGHAYPNTLSAEQSASRTPVRQMPWEKSLARFERATLRR
jgi:sugar lactone lactonase YvrE